MLKRILPTGANLLLITCLLFSFSSCFNAVTNSKAVVNITPGGWYSGDIHVHRNCGEGTVFVTEEKLSEMMEENDLDVVALLADMGNGEVEDAQTDLKKITGKNAPQSTKGRILRWDAEWHWDATYSKFAHQALGGHILLLGLDSAKQIWEESPYKILDWAKKQNAVTGFTHMEYLTDTFQTNLNCCLPLDLPVEAALQTIDFISEDVYSLQTKKNALNSEGAMNNYYRLLNCGFRLGLTAGTDYPCNSEEPLGSLLTYVQLDGELTYEKWIEGVKNGATVVSRNGNHEFLDMKIAGKYGPGADIKITSDTTIIVQLSLLTDREENGKIELLVNGKVFAEKTGKSAPGESLQLQVSVPVKESIWIAARSMKRDEHVTHTAPIWVTKNNEPFRSSKADATYFIDWIDQLLKKTDEGGEWRKFFPNDIDKVRERYKQAREIYVAKLKTAGL